MIKIRIAELNVEIHNHYAFCEKFCRAYLATFDKADITVSVTHEELEREREQSPYPTNYGYLESVCVYRKIALQLPRFNAMVFHASVVECDGVAYAFAAHSGTGKSTHANLWLKVFGKRARIINGDKPIFRLIDGKWYAFGTPWCGKEALGINASSPLVAICFIERDKVNRISAIEGGEMVGKLFSQVLMPENAELADKHLSLLDLLVTATPTYLLHCNMLPEAAIVAHRGMAQGEKMIRNSDFIKRKIGTQYVIVATGVATKQFNGMISVNGTGSFIWDKLESETTLDALVDAIVAEYEVDRATAMADATAFVEKLMGVGAIVK